MLSLWTSALAQNFAAPIWMTFRQALELGAHVRKGEKGSLVVYANSITRTEHDEKTGEDVNREIPFLKGYTAFNVEQIEGLPEIYYAKAAPAEEPREENNTAYIATWLEVLQNDNKAVFTAAAHAQRATDYLHALQNSVTPAACEA